MPAHLVGKLAFMSSAVVGLAAAIGSAWLVVGLVPTGLLVFKLTRLG